MRRRWSALAAMAMVFGCGDGSASPAAVSSSSSGSSGATGDGGVERIDPFCRTRPRLTFCEDFDDAALPGAFENIEGAPAIAAAGDAPSVPNIVGLEGDARLTFQAAKGIKYNFFFLVKLPATHGKIELAGFDDGDDHLVLGVQSDGSWYVDFDGKTITTSFAPLPDEFSSVRFDVYVDGAGKGHLRFRSGADTVFEREDVTISGNKAQLAAPKWFVGAKLVDGARVKVLFDTVTMGDD